MSLERVWPAEYHEAALEPLYFVPGGVGIDVGANAGVHTLAMARSMRAVLALEPDPENYRALLRALGEARVENVSARQVALSDASGPVPFRFAGGQSRVGGTASRHDGGTRPSTQVYARHGSDFLETAFPKLDRVDVVKVDVEGHELAVLRGLERTIARFGPALIVENHSEIEPGYGVDWPAIEGFLASLGYRGLRVTHANWLFRRAAP